MHTYSTQLHQTLNCVLIWLGTILRLGPRHNILRKPSAAKWKAHRDELPIYLLPLPQASVAMMYRKGKAASTKTPRTSPNRGRFLALPSRAEYFAHETALCCIERDLLQEKISGPTTKDTVAATAQCPIAVARSNQTGLNIHFRSEICTRNYR